jgi:biotin transporter BioY
VTDIVVSGWINAALLGFTKELVKSVEGGFLSHFVLGVQILGLADGIVDRAVGRALLRSTWAMIGAWVGCGVLIVDWLGTEMMLVWVISACCSGERLQVSDNCCCVRNMGDKENAKKVIA